MVPLQALDWGSLTPWFIAAAGLIGTSVSAWFAYRAQQGSTAVQLIDRYEKALKNCEDREARNALELAGVRRSNWDLEERLEALEHNDREKDRLIAGLEAEKSILNQEVTRLRVVVEHWERNFGRNTPSGGLSSSPPNP